MRVPYKKLYEAKIRELDEELAAHARTRDELHRTSENLADIVLKLIDRERTDRILDGLEEK